MALTKKHSKYKNTAIIFELLVRQITSDLMESPNSKAINILKKYFNDTELLKEYQLYSVILKSTNLPDNKANIIINTVLEESKKLDRKLLELEKYNLIKEIKKYYDLDNFFKTKIESYKVAATVYTLLENSNAVGISNTDSIVANRVSLFEYITKKPVEVDENTKIVKEFLKEDKDIRILTYRLIVEKYNQTYSVFNTSQKRLLKEYINSISDTITLKKYINNSIEEIKSKLGLYTELVEDKAVKIKLTEVTKLLKPLTERTSIKDDHIINLLQCYELLDELKKLYI